MIKVKNLSKSYQEKRAVNNVTITLVKGAVLVILGPSGCGKTTLLRLFAGFETPDSGEIVLADQIVSTKRKVLAPKTRKLSMIFQDLALWPHMTVYENVAFTIKGNGISKGDLMDQVNEVLTQVALIKHSESYPSSLSGGEKQRLAIARAIISKPAVLLMDEPFNNLDPILKKEIISLIIALKEKLNMTIVCVTHNFDEVDQLADQVVVMNNGEFRASLNKNEFSHFTNSELFNWYEQCL